MSPRIKIDKEKDVEIVSSEQTPVETATSAPEIETDTKEAKPKKADQDWPEVGSTGRFTAVPFKDGYVVYNPSGQRATGVIGKVEADDIVRQSNQAAHIKG